ncbi:MAG: carotenoid oxygenase family protein [Myxococcales bacterium]|nr:carotenoid oxygenase family protein [Myxococcales bacterium]
MLSAAGLVSNLSREHAFEPLRVEGRLPDLQGTLYRNGPGVQERFGRRYDHLFEGDGAVSAVRLSQGRAWGASRIVRSTGYVAEEAAGRHLGSLAAAWPTRLWELHQGRAKNTANTSVLCWQHRLFALMEGGRPTELDPSTLATLGETDLGCIGGTFSAHPHRVASRAATFNFGLRYGRDTQLDLFELPDRGAARLIASVPLPHPVMLHDFVATERHLVFFVAPLRVVVWRMMLALRPFHRGFRWHAYEGTEVIVVPIDEPEAMRRFTVPAFYQWHFGNAFDDGDDIVVDYVRYDAPDLDELAGSEELSFHDPAVQVKGRLHRARIRGEQLVSEAMGELACEFPSVAPAVAGQRHDTSWVQTERFVDGTLEFGIGEVRDGNWRTLWLPRGQVASEPMYVDGHLLTLVFDAHEQLSHWLVVDATAMEVVARVHIGHAVPITFHGTWVPQGA